MSLGTMNRRHFLALVGGAGGALIVPGCGRDEAAPRMGPDAGALGTDEGGAVAAAAGTADSDVEIITVEPGLVDMTSWQGEFLSLRSDPAGMVLRSEAAGRDYPVEVPDGFAGRCVGSVGDSLVVCGHRVVRTGSMDFEAGTPYEELLARAGPEAGRLKAQPRRPSARPFQHIFLESFASLLVTDNLSDWRDFDIALGVGTGGSIGAVLERGALLAADHYSVAEVPDSVFEASLISLEHAATGEVVSMRSPVPVNHGSLWGAADTGTGDMVIIGDLTGTYGYDSAGRALFGLSDDQILLGVEPRGEYLDVAVVAGDGDRYTRRFRGGALHGSAAVPDGTLIKHRISPDVTIAASDGKQALIRNTNIADVPSF